MVILYLGLIILTFVVAVMIFVRQAPFGALPTGHRLERIKRSPHYREGHFQNLSVTPDLTEGVSYYELLRDFLFAKSKQAEPPSALPSQKNSLREIVPNRNALVWFGHSSYFLQVDGKKILVDPVFSGNASPIKSTTRSYPGSDIYSAEDMPDIDYLFLTHDHWDHLDYPTLVKLKPRVKKIITGLGVAAHLERWGFDKSIIEEEDWNEEVPLDLGFVAFTVPARHFSGRGFKRTQSIWSAFVLQTPTMKIFLGGDSGYDHHFATIGNEYGPFDLALLECGQYDRHWKYIHMMPEEVVQAAIDLKAQRLMPVHWAKFTLGKHAWDEPIRRVTEESHKRNVQLIHPMIGEEVNLREMNATARWWEAIVPMPGLHGEQG